MNIASWLEGVLSVTSADEYPLQQQRSPGRATLKRKIQGHQIPTPSSSTGAPHSKRPRPTAADGHDNDGVPEIDDLLSDLDQTPRGPRSFTAWSQSDGTRSGSSGSRSPTKRLAALELSARPVVINQIQRADPRMPAALRDMLDELDLFQSRVGVVPGYLAQEIEAQPRVENNYQYHFFNFQPYTFQPADAVCVDPDISLDRVMEVFLAATECFNERHPEATWNSHVHGPVFQLALGTIINKDSAAPRPNPRDESRSLNPPLRVRAMPCTTARLVHYPHGAKMVDFCIFVEPQGEDADKVQEIRTRLGHSINHTDFYPLRHRPLVLSAESKKPGEGYSNAQIQLGVWQAAQWALLEKLSSAGAETLIPFLPALVIQGHEWSFAATTKSGKQTVCLPLYQLRPFTNHISS